MIKKILHTGVHLSFKISGSGKQAFVFIHNAGGNHQFQYFSQQEMALSVDLRGHGDSDKPDQSYTVNGFAEDLLYICEKFSLTKTIIIGLNYGAIVAIELANISHKLVSHLVLIDPPILMEPWVKQLINDHIDDLKNPYIQNFAENLVESVLLMPTDKNKLIAIRAFKATSKQALISTYTNLLEWDKTSQKKIRSCKMPILNIQSHRPFCNKDNLKKLCSNLITNKVVNSGPWATLEVPEQVNSMIEKFIVSNMQN